MKKSMNHVDRVKRNVINLFFALAAFVAAALGGGAKDAKAETVPDFNYFINPYAGSSQIVRMAQGPPVENYDNLKIRDANGVASVVSKDGTDVWRIGFGKYDGLNLLFGGYANNNNFLSNDNPTILGGWSNGRFYDHVFSDGDLADEVYVIHDVLGDGIGDFTGGTWTYGADDVHYYAKDIEFNGKQGDLNELGPFNFIEAKILPQMTIDARPPRTGPAGINELMDLADEWLMNDCSPESNFDCYGADWDFDGDVDFKDFAYMSKGWDSN